MQNCKIGDWKNLFTVAQNEEFHKVFDEWNRERQIPFIYEHSDWNNYQPMKFVEALLIQVILRYLWDRSLKLPYNDNKH